MFYRIHPWKALIPIGIALALFAVPLPAADNPLANADTLSELLRSGHDTVPRISAHRGGPLPGYPENCIETFEHAGTYGPVLIELDVRMSRDSVLVLMHDETLDRTTTGQGEVVKTTWEEMQALHLVDNLGSPTTYRIPTFREALRWAKGRYIMTVDVKRGVPFPEVVQEIHREDASGSAIVITYSPEAAAVVHTLDPELMLSVPGTSRDVHNELVAQGIPYHRMVAFIGTRTPDVEVVEMWKAAGVRTILGTMGNLDRRAETRGARVYTELYRLGVDILSTDNVPLCSEGLEMLFED